MADDVPSGDKAVYLFIEMIALGFVLYAIEEAFRDNPSWPKVCTAVILGLLCFVLGIKWTQIKGKIWPRLANGIDRIANDYRWRYGATLLVAAAIVICVFLSLRSIQSEFETYVEPRSIRREQEVALRNALAHHEKSAITVKVNPLDTEALEYWGQLSNALRQAEWEVESSTSDGHPHTLNAGLCIHEDGINTKPQDRRDPRHDPKAFLEEALRVANVEVNCSGGSGLAPTNSFYWWGTGR
jgi:hypothetical protein